MKRPAPAKGPILRRIRTYLGEVAAELRKVVWPSREETRRLTVMVIVIAGSIGIFLGVMDYAFTKLMEAILGA